MISNDVPLETREELLRRIIEQETLGWNDCFPYYCHSFFKLRKVGSIDQQIQSIENIFFLYLQALVGQVKHMLWKQQVTEAYGRANNIFSLAPSGAAAALTYGLTIHKGLFFEVRKKGKLKCNGDSEDYGIKMSVSDKRKIREEFKDADILMIDEVSLLSKKYLQKLITHWDMLKVTMFLLVEL